MSVKVATKKTNKRIILDYSQNFNLDLILLELEGLYFKGLSRSEITKLAIVELFKKESSLANLPYLSDLEEESLSQTMASKTSYTTLKTDEDILNFARSLAK
jgi:hypothetical protein